ncbi:MAG TPA: alkaline phosphatase family protein [Phycisphaerae bacterium]|nr:alkaline phosphatase family protein [Phycisphaerae bacterium]
MNATDTATHRRGGHGGRPALLVLTAALAFLAGCPAVPDADGPPNTFGLDFTGTNPAGLRGAVVFFVDGLNAGIFQEMLEANELPAIRRYFVDRGLYAPRAVANTPSVTLANETSFVTGRFPGHHGVTGINWFDRNRLVWRNYETIAQKNTLDADYVVPNLYEQFPDRTTFSLFFQPHRGTTKFVENWTSAGPPFFFGYYEYVDRLALYRFHLVADVARQRGEFPAVTVAYNLAPDFRAYGHGVRSPRYREAIRHTDRQIGRVLGDMERAGLLDQLYFFLVSDHGLMEVTRHWPIEDFLRDELRLEVGSRQLWENTGFEDRLAYYRKYPVVVYGSGDRYWALCLRRPMDGEPGWDAWPVRPRPEDLRRYPGKQGPVDLPAALVGQEAVDAVAYSVGPDRVRVLRRDGEVEFHQPAGQGGPITYRAISGEDPFGWKGAVPADALAGKPLPPRQWLAMTTGTEFPDLPAQIVAYFRSRLAGDIAVFATPGWDFRTVNRAGHGGLRPGDMHVPLLIAGPGIAPGRLAVARTADAMPTILHLLGRPLPPGLDGEPLVRVRGR